MAIVKWKRNELMPNFASLWDDFFSNDIFNRGLELGTSIPAVNLSETDKGYHVEVAAPGLKKEDFKVDVENNVLYISSEKTEEKEEKEGKKVTRKEFSYSSFQRSFQLPENINRDKITAEYKDGLLKLEIPKTEPTKLEAKKKIEIK